MGKLGTNAWNADRNNEEKMKGEDYHDLPREKLMERADDTVAYYSELGQKVEIHFKFTCEKCGERCMLEEANKLYERGECCECGHSTEIKEGGFAMIATINTPKEKV